MNDTLLILSDCNYIGYYAKQLSGLKIISSSCEVGSSLLTFQCNSILINMIYESLLILKVALLRFCIKILNNIFDGYIVGFSTNFLLTMLYDD